MKIRIPIIISLLLLIHWIGYADNVIVRHYGISEGLTHTHIRDMLQDSQGYMWFATWCGIERFDGYEFRNFRSYAGDSIKLDNNRIERIAESPAGDIIIETYGGRIYRFDRSCESFLIGSSADSLLIRNKQQINKLAKPCMEKYLRDNSDGYIDKNGNLWIICSEGVDCLSQRSDAFNFINSTPIDSIGDEIHAIYAAPDGKIWAAARDTRIIIYDSSGKWIGNLSPMGSVVKDPAIGFGRKAYSFFSDSYGRVWVGTKSKELILLTPENSDKYHITRYPEITEPGGLLCADIYSFAADTIGNIWIASFGKGVAKVCEDADGHLSFHFPGNYPLNKYSRVRRLVHDRTGLLIGATTQGVIAFDPYNYNPDQIVFHFTSTEVARNTSLSNDDILDICVANDGNLYFSAFSGGVDWLSGGESLMCDTVSFFNKNISNGLEQDLTLSVIQDHRNNFWVISPESISRYSDTWRLLSTYNSANLGRDIRFTEAQPQQLADGKLVFGRRGGILIIDPDSIPVSVNPNLVITHIEAGGEPVNPDNSSTINLPRGVRDVAIHFTAIEFSGADNIKYAYRLDTCGGWIDLGHGREIRLSSLGAGHTALQLRSTDAYNVLCNNITTVNIMAARTWMEIAEVCLIIFSLSFLTILLIILSLRMYKQYKQKHRLDYYIRATLADCSYGDNGLMAQLCHIIHDDYGNASLKAENVAQRLNTGRNILRRKVKEEIGVSLEEFIRLVRVRAAARLIGDSPLTVSEIAYRCGFKSPQYMSMVFKEQMGCSPSEYAARNRTKS